ncbi:hypothetical protein TRFO_16121 [Tritrichomonas foetus]|uniref:Uncharacterized protein n=1 Tax=Tritrichomonas foetus TaxID=1144522 RepID=A0A1J4KVG5_9EUKA|nr:hypothetical protein TRFO_16121 [Tritrichomonas foetus]|eukprot:OHT13686.1 hypothetical protein TRFO_16121 [Tritrichomonas foetus]
MKNVFMKQRNHNKIVELNIVLRKFETKLDYLANIARTCILNIPKNKDIDISSKQETLMKYFLYFFTTNFSMEDQLRPIAEISSPDPITAFNSFQQIICNNNPKASSLSFKSRIPPEILSLEFSNEIIELIIQILSSIYLRIMFTNSVFLVNNQTSFVQSSSNHYDNQIAKELYDEILKLVFPKNAKDIIPVVHIVSARFWSHTLYVFSSFIQKHIMNSVLDFVQKINEMTVNQVIIGFTFFSGFSIQSVEISQFDTFFHFLNEFPKFYKKNPNKLLEKSFAKFVVNFLCYTSKNSKNSNKSKLDKAWNTLEKFIKPIISKNDYDGIFITILAYSLCFTNSKSSQKHLFVETCLIPKLSPNSCDVILRSFSVLLCGEYYEFLDQMDRSQPSYNWGHTQSDSQQVVEEKTLDLFIYKIVENTTFYSRYQQILAHFFFHLAAFNFDLFLKKYFKLFVSEPFYTHNKASLIMFFTYILAHQSNNSEIKKDCNSNFPETKLHNIQDINLLITISLNKFMRECQIKLAPVDLSLFEIKSLVSYLKSNSNYSSNSDNFTLIISDLKQFSQPLMPTTVKPTSIGIQIAKWQSAVPNMMKTSLFDVYTNKQIHFYNGFTNRYEKSFSNEALNFLNLICFISIDQQIVRGLASFIFSSSVNVSALSIHVLQSIIHTKPHLINKVFNSVCALVKMCPIIETPHLYRILYTIRNLSESVSFLSIKLDDAILNEITSVIILGFCSPHYIVRNEAYYLFNIYSSSNQFTCLKLNNEIFYRQSSELALKTFCYDNSKTTEEFEYFSFAEILSSSYNNIYQFYLANFANELRKLNYAKYYHENLFNLLKFFELESLDPLFVQNLLILIVNLSSFDFVDHQKCEYLMNIASKLGRQCSPALFCAIEGKLMQNFICPFYELLTPLSFSLTMMMDNPNYDESFILKVLDEMIDIVIERCEFSKETENGVDTSVFHVMHAVEKYCLKIQKQAQCYSHSIFPMRKRSFGKVLNISSEVKWIAFLMLVSQCQGAIKNLTKAAMTNVLSLMPLGEEFWESIFTYNSHYKLLSNILCHYPKTLLKKFIDKATSDHKFFRSICMQFESFENISEFQILWKLNLNANKQNLDQFNDSSDSCHSHNNPQDIDDNETFCIGIYNNCGYLIALSFCYLFSSKFSWRANAFNLLAAVSIPCAYFNRYSIEKEIFELRPFLTDSLTVVCRQKLHNVAELLFQTIGFCSEQFVMGIFMFLSSHNDKLNIINYIKQYFTEFNFPVTLIKRNDPNFQEFSFYQFFTKMQELQITPSIFQNIDQKTLKFATVFMIENCKFNFYNFENHNLSLNNKNYINSISDCWEISCIQYFYEIDAAKTLSVLTGILNPSPSSFTKTSFALHALTILSNSSLFMKYIKLHDILSFCYVNFHEFSESIPPLLSSLYLSISPHSFKYSDVNLTNITNITEFLTKEQIYRISQRCLQFGISLKNVQTAIRSFDVYMQLDTDNKERDLKLLFQKLNNVIDIELKQVILKCIKIRVFDDFSSFNLFWNLTKLTDIEEIQVEVFNILTKIIDFDEFVNIVKPGRFEGFLSFLLKLKHCDLKTHSKFVDHLILSGRSDLLVTKNNNELLSLFTIEEFPIEISKESKKMLKISKTIKDINLISNVVDFTYNNLFYLLRKLNCRYGTDNAKNTELDIIETINIFDNNEINENRLNYNDCSKFFKFAAFLIASHLEFDFTIFGSLAKEAIILFFTNSDPNIESFLKLLNQNHIGINNPIDFNDCQETIPTTQNTLQEIEQNDEHELIIKSKYILPMKSPSKFDSTNIFKFYNENSINLWK